MHASDPFTLKQQLVFFFQDVCACICVLRQVHCATINIKKIHRVLGKIDINGKKIVHVPLTAK